MENNARIAQLKRFAGSFFSQSDFQIIPLNTDASARKYYRAKSGSLSVIIMDDEHKNCKTPEFVRLSKFLLQHGIRVPQVFSADLDNGILIIEDLGDNTVHSLLSPQNECELYQKSAEAIVGIAAIEQRPPKVNDFSVQDLLQDIRLFSEWYLPMTIGHPLSENQKSQFLDIIRQLSGMAFKLPCRLMLWDYHVDNIMLPPDSKDCAIIDFQDAMWGPMLYDLVSLLAADRRTASPQTIDTVKNAFYNQLHNISRSDFEDSFAFLSAFRHLRVLGRFTTLSMVKNKSKYLHYIPQCWNMLEKTLEYSKLLPLKQWLDNIIPHPLRSIPSRKPINSAIILAAGRGSRMQNITDTLPKPLVKVGEKSLIDYNFERILSANIDNIVVNICYKGDMIRSHLTQKYPNTKISFSEEQNALETGGGVKHALPLLKGDAFFVCNSDIFFIDKGYKPALWRMMDEWDSQKYDILLLLQPIADICGDKSGDYRITPDGTLERNFQKSPDFPYMFGGISIVSRKIFDNVAEEKFSLRDLFDVAQSKNRLGFVVNTAQFYHVGTPEALAAAKAKFNHNN